MSTPGAAFTKGGLLPMTFYSVLEILSAVLVLLTSICYFYQIVYLILPFVHKEKPHKAAKETRYGVLIAARNEEAVLPFLLESINAQDYPADLITTFVVADNCTDRTAEVAAAHGARVFQRFDAQKVGKGYALNYLLEQLRAAGELENFDAFLVFDADNLLRPDYISQMNRVRSDGYEAFCGYRNTKNFGDSWLSSGCGLWYLHESTHLNRSRMAIGACCTVSGTGFGFNRTLLEAIGGWNFFTLTEDIEFGTWCATRGIRIGYCHDAILYDEQTASLKASIRQRVRWVQGGIQVAIRYSKDLLRGLLRGGHTAWASFETATLSMWGYGMGVVSFSTALLVTFLAERWIGLALALLMALVSAYASMFAVGALTMATEWNRIRATKAQKIRALFTFPLFLFSFAPIAVYAIFVKREWTPIAHTVAISTREL